MGVFGHQGKPVEHFATSFGTSKLADTATIALELDELTKVLVAVPFEHACKADVIIRLKGIAAILHS